MVSVITVDHSYNKWCYQLIDINVMPMATSTMCSRAYILTLLLALDLLVFQTHRHPVWPFCFYCARCHSHWVCILLSFFRKTLSVSTWLLSLEMLAKYLARTVWWEIPHSVKQIYCAVNRGWSYQYLNHLFCSSPWTMNPHYYISCAEATSYSVSK